MLRNTRLLVGLFAGYLAALCLLILSFPRALPAQEKKNLRLVLVSLSWNSELPFRAAMAKGYFREQGLSIEPIFIRGGPAAMAALVSGDADFGSIGGAQAVIRARSRGLNVAIIGSISNTVNYAVVGSKGTKSLAELRGKIVGVTGAGAFSDFAIRTLLKKNHLEPDKDVVLRAVGNTTMRAAALENGLIAAAPFSPEDAVRLTARGFPLIINLSESLRIPQSILITRDEMMEKFPETSKRFLKAYILGLQLAKKNKKEAIKLGYDAGLKGEPDIVNRAYDLYSPGLTSDLSIAVDGIQLMVDEDILAGLVDKKMTVDRVINDRVLKLAQQELRKEGRLSP
jgi:NitT/TauT family transport system substrate-binding protein